MVAMRLHFVALEYFHVCRQQAPLVDCCDASVHHQLDARHPEAVVLVVAVESPP